MNVDTFRYGVAPTVITLILHVTLVYLASVEWLFRSSPLNVSAPRVLQASLHSLSEIPVNAGRRPADPNMKESQIAEPKPLPTAEPLRVPVPDAPVDLQPAAAPEVPQPEVPPAPEIAEPVPTVEAAPQPTVFDEAALSELLQAEELRRQAEQVEQVGLVAGFVDAITRRIEANWRRPPNARRDMEVQLQIQLLPSGEVQGVRVLQSSGFTRFDDSAVNAVRRSRRFPEIESMPTQLFEREFRRLHIYFRPEDLLR